MSLLKSKGNVSINVFSRLKDAKFVIIMTLLSRPLSQNIYLLKTQKYLLVIYLIIFSGHRTLAKLDQLLILGEYSGSSESQHESIGDVVVGQRQNLYRPTMISTAVVVSENNI